MQRNVGLVAIIAVLAGAPAQAAELYVVDGDTLYLGREKIRLTSDAGPIDAPEIHADGYSPARYAREIEQAGGVAKELIT